MEDRFRASGRTLAPPGCPAGVAHREFGPRGRGRAGHLWRVVRHVVPSALARIPPRSVGAHRADTPQSLHRHLLLRPTTTYYDAALYFVLGTSGPAREAATYRAMQQQWDTASELCAEQVFTVKKRSELMNRQFLLQARSAQVPTDAYLLGSILQTYTIPAEVSARIAAPTLAIRYELDGFVPAGEAQQLSDSMRVPADLVVFAVAEGAVYHCAPMAPQRRNQVVLDWSERIL